MNKAASCQLSDAASNVARVEAIKAALGLPPSVVGAIPIVGAASMALGIDAAETAKL